MRKKRFITIMLIFAMSCLSMLSNCSAGENGNAEWALAIPCEYDSVRIDLDGDFITVSKNNKIGLYQKEDDLSYKLLFAPEYDNIEYTSGDLFDLTKDGQASLYTSQGSKLFEQSYSDIWSTSGELGFSVRMEDGHWGFISQKGEWLIPPTYGGLIPLQRDAAFLVTKDVGGDVIDLNGNSVIPSGMRLETAEINAPYIYVANQDYTLHGVLDLSGNIVVPLEYQSVEFYPSRGQGTDYFIVRDTDGRCSILRSHGEIVLSDLPYESIKPTAGNHFIVKQNGTYGLMRLDGSLSIPIECDSISFPYDYDKGLVNKNGAFFISDLDGKMTQVKADVDSARGFAYTYQNGLFRVGKGNQYGYMDFNGELTVPLSYEYADTDIYEGLLLVKKDGKFGYIDQKNTVKIPFAFSYASNFQSGYALVAKDDKMGIIDSTGRLVVPYQFEVPAVVSEENKIIHIQETPIYPVEKDGKFGCVVMRK